MAHGQILTFLEKLITLSTCVGVLRIFDCASALSSSLIELSNCSSQSHCPLILSTFLHIPSRPIKSTSRIFGWFVGILRLIFLTVSTTILCWDCLPVKNRIFRLSEDDLWAVIALAKAAAVFPIPVGADANKKPLLNKASIPSCIISD